MPTYNNALTDQPANRLAFPSSIGPVPRNEYLGALADFLAKSYSPERTQQMQGISQLLGMPAVSRTLDMMSYGDPLTTGAGGLGGTTRVKPDVLEAALTVAPLGKPATMATLQAARLARQAAMAGGRAGERYAERVVPQIMERGGEMLKAVPTARQDITNYSLTPQGQYQVTQPTPAMQTWGGFSSEADYAAYQQAQKNQAERMKSAWADVQQQDLSKVLPFETGPVSQRDIDYDILYKAFPGTLVTPSTARTMLEKNMLKASKQEKDLLRKYIDEKGKWIPNTESRQPTQSLGGPLSQVDNVPPSNMAMQNVAEYNLGGGLLTPIKNIAPQQAALDLAQQRAALPVEQGGLGLAAGNTADQRAAAQYGKDMVHFSRAGGDYTTLDSGKFAIAPFDAVGTHVGTPQAAMERFQNTVGYKVNNPNYANDELKGATYPVTILGNKPLMNQNGMPFGEDDLNAFLRQQGGHNYSDIHGGKMTYQDMNADLRKKLFEEQGYTSIPYYNEVEGKGSISYIVPPENIRSRFAAFDPFRRSAAIAATMGVAAPDLLAAEDDKVGVNKMRKLKANK